MENTEAFQFDGTVLTKYTGRDEDVVIPQGVTAIGQRAFAGRYNLSSVHIPDSVTSIGNEAFLMCIKLTRLTIPDSVTSIGSGAFQQCEWLTHLTIPEGITEIPRRAFFWCSELESISLPDSVTSIADDAFGCCRSLASITIPKGVRSIGTRAFYSCEKLTSVVLPEGLTHLGDMAFIYCRNLTSLHIPQGTQLLDKGWLTFLLQKTRLEVLRVPGRRPGRLRPYLEQAALGYAELVAEGQVFSQSLDNRYRSYMEIRRKALYPKTMAHPALLRYMMDRRIIRPAELEELFALTDRENRPDLKAELLQYAQAVFSGEGRPRNQYKL